ncbi:hypothetical protein [Streptomyces xanthophaeus]|uniref:hypothetical protein n=1 Tax=Streptomyces xanthophaeus TaxID=67385 RepID=UPI0004CD5E01|nr:hypothetical protein [Streptomyces xanthophaeus]
MTTRPQDPSPEPGEPTKTLEEDHGNLRAIWEGTEEFFGELLGESIVQALSCLLLLGAGYGLWWGWQQSPDLMPAPRRV